VMETGSARRWHALSTVDFAPLSWDELLTQRGPCKDVVAPSGCAGSVREYVAGTGRADG